MIILCTSSRGNAFARALERRVAPFSGELGTSVDGVVSLTHTEDGSGRNGPSNNRDLLLRTLLGLLLHPNVGAALVLSTAEDNRLSASGRGVNYTSLETFAAQNNRSRELEAVPHTAVTIATEVWTSELDRCESTLMPLLTVAERSERSQCPLSSLIVAQQCGGSDAFSGTCANPLVADASKLLISCGGGAVLAETDELIGAEAYVLSRVRDFETASSFMKKVNAFHDFAMRHGASAEGNPSGGNIYRGLYNIALKSLGAAMKRHPDVRLEQVLQYAEPIEETTSGPGYCFMDSPGNDLESLTGQVASGCNIIYFTTGNGSITNCPICPTIKIVSTHARFLHMASDMDVDAGASKHRDILASELFELTQKVASGTRTKGEKAGHHQIQIWRDWMFNSPCISPVITKLTPDGRPLSLFMSADDTGLPTLVYEGFSHSLNNGDIPSPERIALILPTSLCSAEVARAVAAGLQSENESQMRFVALAHTEGCGISDEAPAAAIKPPPLTPAPLTPPTPTAGRSATRRSVRSCGHEPARRTG